MMHQKPSASRPLRRSWRSQGGFTLIELLVSLGLISLVGVVAGGFLLPLRLTRQANLETQGLSYARSYIEALKTRWASKAGYNPANQATSARPVVAYDTDTATVRTAADVVLPASWTVGLVVTPSTNDTYRSVTVTVTPAGTGTPLVLTTRVVQP
jgi:prepilin-type N-terminal cleavage/methylation domain-containing protein